MKETTKEEKKIVQDKLKFLKLDLDNVSDIFEVTNKIKYRPIRDYDNTTYKSYKFIDISNIQIYITKATRMESAEKKYKLAKPIIEYLDPKTEEEFELHAEFIEMLKKLDIEKMEELEKEQKEFKKQIPYEIKYKNNFSWDIYYSEAEDKYFMMFPSKENQVETLFYAIKKQIEAKKSKRANTLVYVPISNKQTEYEFLKRSEIADLENYLWFFTANWPSIYEVEDKDNNKTIQIIGEAPVYENIKSLYKIVLKDKEEAQREFKLIKALFILKSNIEQEYDFKIGIDENAKLNFFYNHNKITYENLPNFIKTEIEKKREALDIITKENVAQTEKKLLLQEILKKQNEEYVLKEKQIVTFLECKKSFFKKVSYFFKGKKKIKKEEIAQDVKSEVKEGIKIEKLEIEEKKFYTIEDLLKIATTLEDKEKEYKNIQMDIKALEIKKENLENKIKNATLYINEIESHKKSIFDFWKFTNKDEVSLLNEAQSVNEEEKHTKIKKVFSYEDDMEDLSIKIDEKQKRIFTQKVCDAIFAIYNDVDVFNLISKEKILKKDEKQIEKSLEEKKQQYKNDYEKIKEKDFDIFGSVVEDKTKIKTLKKHKHREIEKDIYKVLDIHLDTTVDEYKDNIKHYEKLLEENKDKMIMPYDMSLYKIADATIENDKWIIMNINPEEEIIKNDIKEDILILNKINLKENMPVIFYSNIMFYDNLNQTLPSGMDITEKVLLDLQDYDLKLVSRKDFNMNFIENEFESKVKTISLYEYNVEIKQK